MSRRSLGGSSEYIDELRELFLSACCKCSQTQPSGDEIGERSSLDPRFSEIICGREVQCYCIPDCPYEYGQFPAHVLSLLRHSQSPNVTHNFYRIASPRTFRISQMTLQISKVWHRGRRAPFRVAQLALSRLARQVSIGSGQTGVKKVVWRNGLPAKMCQKHLPLDVKRQHGEIPA